MNIVTFYRCFLSVFCGLCVLVLWVDYERTPMMINTKKVSSLSAPGFESRSEAPVFQFASLLDLSEVTIRPLFIDGRQVPLVEQAAVVKKTAREEPFTLEVTGIVTSGDTRMAVLRNRATRKENTLYLGGELPDNYTQWILDGVDGKQVVVKKKTLDNNNHDRVDSDNDNTKKLSLTSEVYYTIDEAAP